MELTRRNIPFVKFGGLKFLDAAHVKDCWRCCASSRTRATASPASACCSCCPASGRRSAQRVLDRMAEAADPIAALAGVPAPPRGGRGLGGVRRHRAGASAGDGRLAGRDRAGAALVRAASRAHPRGCRDAPADLVQLEQIAAGYPSRERFLTELTLDPPDATSDQAGVPLLDEDYLILSTIHSAKGQEWKSVFVLNVVDGCIPSDLGTGTTAEIEEERRLLYVAMTRAKDDLHLVVPQRFYTHGQRPRRPARLRVAHAVHSGATARPVRAEGLASGCSRERSAQCQPGTDRPQSPHPRAVGISGLVQAPPSGGRRSSSVRGSISPSHHRSSARRNWLSCSCEATANRVMHERNFKSSGEPKSA